MPLIELPIKPGIVRDNSFLLSESRWIDADKVRFRRVGDRSHPEVIGGFEDLTEETFSGKCRALHSYETLDGDRQIILGTHTHLYVYTGALLWDITPIDATGALSNAITTTSGSKTVSIAHTTHGRLLNSQVYLHNAAAAGGLNLGASGSFTNAITVSEGSTALIISVASHGLSDGDRITLAGSSSVGGIAATEINKTHTCYVISPDQIMLTAATKATSDATAGGSVTWTAARGYTVTAITDANNYTIEAKTNAGSTASGVGGALNYEYAINAGQENTTARSGYSSGGYAEGYYSLPSSETDLRARVWTINDFKNKMVGNYRNSKIYTWDNQPSQRAAPIAATDCPIENLTNMVTPENFLFTMGTIPFGGSFDPMMVSWADQNQAFNTGDWQPTPTNTANFVELAEGSRIIAGVPMPFVSLVWTDTSLYSFQYVTDPDVVYRQALIGTGCGLIGPNAYARAGDSGQVFWLSSSREFMAWSGGTPVTVSCPVRDFLFDNLAEQQEDLICGGVNEQYNEIWWWYPTPDENENHRYIALNYSELHWTVGTFSITAWQERGVEEFPIAAFANGSLRIMEKSNTANGAAFTAYLESGLTDVKEGENHLFVKRYVPDFSQLTGAVNVKVLHREWPQGAVTETDLGAVNATTEKVDFRISTRQMAIRYDWNSSPTDGRLGRIMFDITPTQRTR